MNRASTLIGSAGQRRESPLRLDDARADDGEPAPNPSAGLVVSGVTKSWGERRVLRSVSLQVPPGVTAWVGGKNGVGKTTLLRIVAGLILAEEGDVTLDGLDPRRDRRRYQEEIGFLSAGDRGLYARLSVRQNLELWARLAFLRGAGARATIAAMIERFSLEDLAEARVDRLSLGQRQRVRLSMAFLHDPRLVMLDEPLNSLDEDGIALLCAALADLNSRGGAAIWCSPSPPELREVSRLYELCDGRLEERR
jgi:ABC-2 type transport system ATP-binding protein